MKMTMRPRRRRCPWGIILLSSTLLLTTTTQLAGVVGFHGTTTGNNGSPLPSRKTIHGRSGVVIEPTRRDRCGTTSKEPNLTFQKKKDGMHELRFRTSSSSSSSSSSTTTTTTTTTTLTRSSSRSLQKLTSLISGKRRSKLNIRNRLLGSFLLLRATKQDSEEKTKTTSSGSSSITSSSAATWSRSGKSSRFGVRKRVKEVLKKARNRTGIENYSEDTLGSVVAEAASIGGLAKESDLELQPPPKNGSTSSSIHSQLSEEYLVPVKKKTTGEEQRGGNNEGSKTSRRHGPPSSSPPSSSSSSLSSSSSPSRSSSNRSSSAVDGVKADVLTALPEPLPFTLPTLSTEQRQLLETGERVQEQSRMGREGSGFVVVDVKAPPLAIWESLLDFEAYPQMIKTVREMTLFTSKNLKYSVYAEEPVSPGTGREIRHYGTPSLTRASFVLSKFRLNIAAIHNYRPHPDGHYMIFTLDPASSNAIFQDAKGIWYTEQNPDGRGKEYTRVWLLCELKCSRILPTFIVDYAAKRAMPRATTWLKPHVEIVAKEMGFLNDR